MTTKNGQQYVSIYLVRLFMRWYEQGQCGVFNFNETTKRYYNTTQENEK